MSNKIYKKIKAAGVPESKSAPMMWKDLTPECRSKALERHGDIIDDVAERVFNKALYNHIYGIQKLEFENFSYSIEDVTSPNKIDISWDADISIVIEADLNYEIPRVNNFLKYYVKLKFDKGNKDPKIDMFLSSSPSFEIIDSKFSLTRYYKNLYNELKSAGASESVLSEVKNLCNDYTYSGSSKIWNEFRDKTYTFANEVSKKIIDYIDTQIIKITESIFIKNNRKYTYEGDFFESK